MVSGICKAQGQSSHKHRTGPTKLSTKSLGNWFIPLGGGWGEAGVPLWCVMWLKWPLWPQEVRFACLQLTPTAPAGPRGSVCPVRALRAACVRPAHYFYYDFLRFSPQVHHYPMKPRAGECDDVMLRSDCEQVFHQQGGPRGTFGGTSIAGTDGNGGGESRLGIPKESMGHR